MQQASVQHVTAKSIYELTLEMQQIRQHRLAVIEKLFHGRGGYKSLG